jgi:hypothetical protein
MAGKQAGWVERSNPIQRIKIVPEVSPFASRDHDRATLPNEIATIQIAVGFIEEAEMVGSMPRCGNDSKPRIGALHDVAVEPESDHFRRGPFLKHCTEPTDVIGMSVRNQEALQRSSIKRRLDTLQMACVANAHVNQRWHTSGEEKRVGTGRASPRRRVVGGKQNHRMLGNSMISA